MIETDCLKINQITEICRQLKMNGKRKQEFTLDGIHGPENNYFAKGWYDHISSSFNGQQPLIIIVRRKLKIVLDNPYI